MNRTRKFYRILSLVLLISLIAAMAISFVACDKQNDGDEEVVKTFTFVAKFVDGTSKTYTVETTKKTVGEALIDEGLIAGEDGPYGLYVKTVDGVTLDYDTDGMYWAFYANGQYATAGVDKTDIVDGATYSFEATAG